MIIAPRNPFRRDPFKEILMDMAKDKAKNWVKKHVLKKCVSQKRNRTSNNNRKKLV